MTRPTYRLTNTARDHLKKALKETQEKWGAKQARKYSTDFLAGLQHIADNHRTLHSPHRAQLAKDTPFSLHLVEHRYVIFQVHDPNTIIIVGIFHENMDIPSRLKELHAMTQHEITRPTT